MTLAIGPTTRRARRAVRRAVQLEADVMSHLWDGGVPLPLTNLSRHGAWLDSDLALDVGDELGLVFTPPRWSSLGLPSVRARASVVRVCLHRRRSDSGQAGMGLRFLELPRVTEGCLDYVLRGLPPPLPAAHVQPSHGVDDELELRLDDGTSFNFRAEAPLFSTARTGLPRRSRDADCYGLASVLRSAAHVACANDRTMSAAPIGSPLTAIFRRPRMAVVS